MFGTTHKVKLSLKSRFKFKLGLAKPSLTQS